jgi:hypothetical protein
MIVSVIAAFFDLGLRKAGIPLLIASTPHRVLRNLAHHWIGAASR